MGKDELKRILEKALGVEMEDFRVLLEVTEIAFSVNQQRHVIDMNHQLGNELLVGATTFLLGEEGSTTEALGVKIIESASQLLDKPWANSSEQ
jgi:hypothetical protein